MNEENEKKINNLEEAKHTLNEEIEKLKESNNLLNKEKKKLKDKIY